MMVRGGLCVLRTNRRAAAVRLRCCCVRLRQCRYCCGCWCSCCCCYSGVGGRGGQHAECKHIMVFRSLPSFGPASSCLLGAFWKSSSWPPVAMHRTAGRRCPGGLLSPQQAAQPSPARPAQPSPPSRHRAGIKYCNLRCGLTRWRQLTPTAAAVLGAGNLMVFARTPPE